MAAGCFLNLVILCFSFHLINASILVIHGQKPAAFTPCNQDSDCAGFGAENFTCLNKYCQCDGSKFCFHSNKAGLNKLEESCSTNSDCIIEYSICDQGKCQCEKNTVASLDKRSCLINSSNDTCTNCSETQNTCSGSHCSCEKGFVQNSDLTQCLKVAVTIHDFCKEDVQCSETFVNAVCINTSCQCPTSYKFNSTIQACIKKSVLGGQCEIDEDCEQNSRVSCVLGHCECNSQFVEKEGQCTSLIEPCIEPLCSEFSGKMQLNQTCIPGRCECPEERQFCTNSDNDKFSYYRTTFSDGNDNEKIRINPDYLVQRILKELCLRFIHALVLGTWYLMNRRRPNSLEMFRPQIIAYNLYLIVLSLFLVFGYYDHMKLSQVTSYLIVPIICFLTVYGTVLACDRYFLPHIVDCFFPIDDAPEEEVQSAVSHSDVEHEVSEILQIQASPPPTPQTEHTTEHTTEGRKRRKRKGKKRNSVDSNN